MPDHIGTFTERAREVLMQAQAEAQRLRHRQIGTEHLLLGVADLRDGVAPMALMNLAVDPRAVRSVLEELLTPGTEPSPAQPALSDEAKRSLELAVAEARRMEQARIDAEHILLGLAETGGSPAAEVLGHLGARPDLIRAEIERLLAVRRAE